MNDAENLSKLLGHLAPAMFCDFMVGTFKLTMPDLDEKQAKKEQRVVMEAVLVALAVSQRQQIEDVAERIVLLSDGAGQDVVDGFRDSIFDEDALKEFDALHNQYERALWFYLNDSTSFEEALNARQADVFRQNASCFQGSRAQGSGGTGRRTVAAGLPPDRGQADRLFGRHRRHPGLQAAASGHPDRGGRGSVPDQRPSQPPARDHRLRPGQRTRLPGSYPGGLRQTQGTIRTEAPNWQPWLEFFLRSLAEQVRRLEKKVDREKLVLAPLPELSLAIVEFAREHGRIAMSDAIRLTGASRNTLKLHFRALVERDHLVQHGSGRGVWYELR